MPTQTKFDPTERILFLKIGDIRNTYAIEENLQLILSPSRVILELRIELANVVSKFKDTPVESLVADCLASGWSLSRPIPIPILSFQFAPVGGSASVFDWVGDVYVDDRRKSIAAIEILLTGRAAGLGFNTP